MATQMDKEQNLQALGFGSDNQANVAAPILQAMVACNVDYARSYGQDPWTLAAEQALQTAFGGGEVFFVWNGTAANVLVLQALMPSYGAVLCTDLAHLHVHECGAPERIVGCKVQPIAHHQGKLTPERIKPYLRRFGDQHVAQPKVLSITQPTEVGTLYSRQELMALIELAHSHGLKVHMDGARLAYAAAAMNCSLAALTSELGVDGVAFGGNKGGLMFGEAVILFDGDSHAMPYWRKQCLQLAPKMRYIGAQYQAYCANELWRSLAKHANDLAKRLAGQLEHVAAVRMAYPVETNGVFVHLPAACYEQLHQQYAFYLWDEATYLARLLTSHATQETDVDRLVAAMQAACTS